MLFQVKFHTEPQGCDKAVADVMLVLDDSSSVGSTNFKKVKRFAQNIVKSFNIGRNKIRVGAITFSGKVKLQFKMNKYYNKRSLLRAISRIKYKHGGTNTNRALDYLRTQSFRRGAGDRKGVPNIAIVLTDGKAFSLRKTKIAALKLRKTGAIVFAIGVGRGIKRSELNVIGCDKAVADVMLVLDDSSSVGSTNFKKVKRFAQYIVNSFNIGRNKIRVGAITFSGKVKLQFKMNKYYNKRSLLRAISRIKYKHGGTNTNRALDYLRTQSFRRGAGDRKGVPNIAIVLTDGKAFSRRKTKIAALKLRKTGAIVFAIGVGRGIKRSELNVIGCDKAVADVMLVLDDSSSVGSTNFKKVKRFAQYIVNSFNIGRNKIRVGAITFSGKVKLQFKMNKYYNKRSLLRAISRIKYKHGGTNTNRALDYLRTQSFRRGAGDRKGVPNIAIVLTDGKAFSRRKTKIAALKLRKTGAIVFAIGVGRGIKRSELNVIGCDKAVADVMLVLDDSSSVGSTNFKKVKRFAQYIVNSFNIGRNKIRVGAITFSGKVKLQFKMNKYYNKRSLLRAISRIKYKHGGTNTNRALDYLRTQSFRRGAGDRKGVPNIAIVLTDGKAFSLRKTKIAALKLRKTGAIVFAIGVGRGIKRSELNVIGCDKAVADVMLVLDDSSSVGSTNFKKVKRFAQYIVNSFNIGRNKIRVGAITFSGKVKLQFKMNKYYNKRSLLRAISRIKYKHGGTNTNRALDYLRTQSFRRGAGDRKGVPNIAIVLTDGKAFSRRKTKIAALKLRKTGAIVFAIGVGRGIKRSELNVIVPARPCVCSASGDPHYKTFDGQMIHFMGTCKYTLVTPHQGSNYPHFKVEVKNEHRGRNKRVSYTRLVDVKLGNNTLRLLPRRRITVNGVRFQMPINNYLGFTVKYAAGWVRAETAFGLLVKFDGNHRVIVKVPGTYRRELTGICGDCNGKKDDWRTKAGVNVSKRRNKYSLIGKSYEVPDDSDKPQKKRELTGICGDCNGKKDDWRTKAGVNVSKRRNKYSLIGKSYEVPDDSDKPQKNHDKSHNNLTVISLQNTHSRIGKQWSVMNKTVNQEYVYIHRAKHKI
ncbi:Hypothetical predicted protein [Octopus vulgaris]|uniref:Uncharacterized protein n=1 Tax=Octopus vulgaris TaxID=6645 RepID=A0AA36APU3_OCTVU|nr:Hypothetical predicted protein [Octopus vulgaris]